MERSVSDFSLADTKAAVVDFFLSRFLFRVNGVRIRADCEEVIQTWINGPVIQTWINGAVLQTWINGAGDTNLDPSDPNLDQWSIDTNLDPSDTNLD